MTIQSRLPIQSGAFDIGWHEAPKRTIYGFIPPRGYLTRPDFPNRHGALYDGFPPQVRG